MSNTNVESNGQSGVQGGKLPFSEKIAYGLGNFGQTLIQQPIMTFLMIYFTDVSKINPVIVSTLLMATQPLNLITNPVVGVISDNETTENFV